MDVNDKIEQYFRLVPQQKGALRKLGIETIGDMLRHFPARYDQGGEAATIAGLTVGSQATIFGVISKLDTRKSWKRRIAVGEAEIRDATGAIKVMWFHQPYVVKKFSEGMYVKAVGTIGGKEGKFYLANPHIERADPSDAETGLFAPKPDIENEHAHTLFAVYPESQGITSLWFRHAIEKIISTGILTQLEETIPANILEKYHLPDIATAMAYIHMPEKESHSLAARKRFAFEEIFVLQVARAKEREENASLRTLHITNAQELADTFLSSLPFAPTGAQQRAIKEITADFAKEHPMARLLEGDVGAGKTLVAAATAYAAVHARPPERNSGTLQVAYMAPTEILAAQHFQSFTHYFKDIPINIGLITGSGCKKFPSKGKKDEATTISRTQLLKWVANGEIAMVIGTHALIQESVQFKHLAYTIIDEQHRFGTKQRRALAQKGANQIHPPPSPLNRGANSRAHSSPPVKGDLGGFCIPHFLSMTATPIPRTLALTIYGDLDISILDELPPGRAKVTTKIISQKSRKETYELARNELKAGRQMYVICPRIDEPDPEKLNAVMTKSAKAEAARLQKEVFPEYTIDLLHGGMKPKEKDAVMMDFAAGKTHILVATSVVEVGVNVPNATVIFIEGAERFGLAQLHQLRGRVMRSSHPPFCFLLSDSPSAMKSPRLKALEKSDDGFKLAEHDLESRGAGDLYGRKQWGISDIGMEALKNPKLIHAARTEAAELIKKDPELSHHSHLRDRVRAANEELHRE